MGFNPGQFHPEMDPRFLVNTPWWKEPPGVTRENNLRCLKQFINLYFAQMFLGSDSDDESEADSQISLTLSEIVLNYYHQQQQNATFEVDILPLD